jgi:hypothetical protein
MTLERKVKTLEYEMKILKNEIQQTLLDIQEQLLIHYYPSLRTEETSPPEGILRSIEAIQKKKKEQKEAEEQARYLSEE